tara:strand:- start:625 stop:1017 length:393 start_codon:yes stop_codon:yes gene_type:complete
MGQRINIQYSIDIDDLGTEVERHLGDTYQRYLDLQEQCTIDPADVTLSYETLEKVDKIRIALIGIDHRLNDASNIISGYLQFRAQDEEVPAADPVYEEIAPTANLKNQLTQFNELMNKVQRADEVSDQGK